MKKLLLCLLLFQFISLSSYSQVIDTIYLKKSGKISNSKNFDFYRVAKSEGVNIQVNDYNKKNILRYSGLIKLDSVHQYKGNITNKIGAQLFYNKKGNIDKMEIYQPKNYPQYACDLYNDCLDHGDEITNDLIFLVYYYKDGTIQSKHFVQECKSQFKWVWYNNKGNIRGISRYESDIREGKTELYLNGKISSEHMYSQDKKHGYFRDYNPFDNIIIREGNYQHGKKHGEFKYYTWGEGHLKKIVTYNQGKKVRKTKINH